MLSIDGSLGEGGGQILRTSLAMSVVTRTPIHLFKIRRGRPKPGLQKQHLTSVLAAAEISGAEVSGASLGSQEIVFRPATLVPGAHRFSIGSAGSASLVLQTVLPPLLFAAEPSELLLEGGTHNPMSPPFDFLAKTFAPSVGRMGARMRLELLRHGFYPAGGGSMRVRIDPVAKLEPIELVERGRPLTIRARALLSKLPRSIGERELRAAHQSLQGLASIAFEQSVEEIADAEGQGNVLFLELESEAITEVVTGFGEKGRPAERVAKDAVKELIRYASSSAPVGEHLADQLLLPMVLAGGGVFRTGTITEHTRTNIDVLKRFGAGPFAIDAAADGGFFVRLSPNA
jgi:RNA 3'-terminal phosphate cyclase (ATP)